MKGNMLYDLIWKRTVVSQMGQSINLETSYYIQGGEILLKASGSIEKFKVLNLFMIIRQK